MAAEELTLRISLIRKAPNGGISSIAEHPVEHTYKNPKSAREDYELLVKLFEKISGVPEVD